MQLVGGRVRVLNPAKSDLIIDEKKVEEIMGVPPSKVADVMALMGDSIDNIPGARDPNDKPAPGERRKAGIGEVGARQLIQQFGSAEEAIARAGEVKRSSYREALEKNAKFVHLSKQLATIPTDAPVPLSLDALRIQEPDARRASRALRRARVYVTAEGARCLFAGAAADDRTTDYAALDSPAALRKFLDAVPRGQETAVWLSLDSEDPDDEGFGTRVTGVEVSTKPDSGRTAANDVENKTLAAMKEWLADAKRPKVVHDPKLFHLLAAPDSADGAKAVAGIRHATILYSYLLRPTTANHAFAEVVLRHMNRTLSGAPGERADFLLRLAPVLRAEVEKQGLAELYEKIDLPLAPVLARMEAAGIRVDSRELEIISAKAQEEISRARKEHLRAGGIRVQHQIHAAARGSSLRQAESAAAAPQPHQSALDGRRSSGRTGARPRRCRRKYSNIANWRS